MTNVVTIKVRSSYVLPPLYNSQYGDELSELALNIGATCVQNVLSTKYKTTDIREEIDQINDKLEKTRQLKDKFEKEVQLLKKSSEDTAKIKQLCDERAEIIESLKTKLITEATSRGEEIARRRMIDETSKLRMQFTTELETSLDKERTRLKIHYETERAALAELTATLKKVTAPPPPPPAPTMAVKSSSDLGRGFEESVANYIRQAYGMKSGFKLEDVHAHGHMGDLILEYDGIRIMFELKNYSVNTKIPTKEVEKLARDLNECSPKCHAAVMISANCEITGHYTCGNFEICTTLAPYPILFVNNFLQLGDPHITLHMMRVFLDMILFINRDVDIEDDTERVEYQKIECVRRCSEFIQELDKQSTEIMKQITILQNASTALKKSVTHLVESEITRFEGIKRLLKNEDVDLKNIFRPPHTLTDEMIVLARTMTDDFEFGVDFACSIKDLVAYIKIKVKKGDIRCREIINSLFIDQNIQRGQVVGLKLKAN